MKKAPSNIAEALAAEIIRVSEKRERWIGYKRDMDQMSPGSGAGMALTIAFMKQHADEGLHALASGNVTRMILILESLRDYSTDD